MVAWEFKIPLRNFEVSRRNRCPRAKLHALQMRSAHRPHQQPDPTKHFGNWLPCIVVLALLLPERAKRGRFAYIAYPPAHFRRNSPGSWGTVSTRRRAAHRRIGVWGSKTAFPQAILT